MNVLLGIFHGIFMITLLFDKTTSPFSLFLWSSHDAFFSSFDVHAVIFYPYHYQSGFLVAAGKVKSGQLMPKSEFINSLQNPQEGQRTPWRRSSGPTNLLLPPPPHTEPSASTPSLTETGCQTLVPLKAKSSCCCHHF